MKKILLSLVLSVAAIAGANAMSFSRAQAEALYLTDKMAYELNLNDQQYNDAYEINLDYFLRMQPITSSAPSHGEPAAGSSPSTATTAAAATSTDVLAYG